MITTLIKLFAAFAVLDGIITFYALGAYPGLFVEGNPVMAAAFAFEPMVASVVRLGVIGVAALVFWEMYRVEKHRRWAVFWVCVLLDVEIFAVLANLGLLCLIAVGGR